MQILLTIVAVYLAMRFALLGLHVARQGYHPLWVVHEWVTALLCLLLLWPVWA